MRDYNNCLAISIGEATNSDSFVALHKAVSAAFIGTTHPTMAPVGLICAAAALVIGLSILSFVILRRRRKRRKMVPASLLVVESGKVPGKKVKLRSTQLLVAPANQNYHPALPGAVDISLQASSTTSSSKRSAQPAISTDRNPRRSDSTPTHRLEGSNAGESSKGSSARGTPPGKSHSSPTPSSADSDASHTTKIYDMKKLRKGSGRQQLAPVQEALGSPPEVAIRNR